MGYYDFSSALVSSEIVLGKSFPGEGRSRALFSSLWFSLQKKSKKSSETLTFKRPEGMHREVYALLYSDKKQVLGFQVPFA